MAPVSPLTLFSPHLLTRTLLILFQCIDVFLSSLWLTLWYLAFGGWFTLSCSFFFFSPLLTNVFNVESILCLHWRQNDLPQTWIGLWHICLASSQWLFIIFIIYSKSYTISCFSLFHYPPVLLLSLKGLLAVLRTDCILSRLLVFIHRVPLHKPSFFHSSPTK